VCQKWWKLVQAFEDVSRWYEHIQMRWPSFLVQPVGKGVCVTDANQHIVGIYVKQVSAYKVTFLLGYWPLISS